MIVYDAYIRELLIYHYIHTYHIYIYIHVYVYIHISIYTLFTYFDSSILYFISFLFADDVAHERSTSSKTSNACDAPRKERAATN